MSLKKYLSIKFIVYNLFLLMTVYVTTFISSESRNLKEKNKILSRQKENYERILQLPDENKNGKKLFYDSIKMDDSLLEDKSSSSDISTSVLLNVLIILIGIGLYSLNYLDRKIDKLKREENDFERQQML
nr:hypothetical protein [uncultured Flavobacterium sp.]